MKKLVVGILAHVDAGKTTLSESMLYISGKTRKMGRVDNKDAYLDNFELERARGITIFAKQAVINVGDVEITLLDTPGHVDFSAEMERTLKVLDYAILVINGADGVKGHTKTLWHLLEIYNIPVFVFVNKMDQIAADKNKILNELKVQFGNMCIDFGQGKSEELFDQLAMCDDKLLKDYLEIGRIEEGQIMAAINNRSVVPCFFGSALKLEGVADFLKALEKYTIIPVYSDNFGAKIFKVDRDDKGNRLTHMKITGGKLKVKDVLSNGVWEDKVNQIRTYSGAKYDAVSEVEAGTVCAVTGLSQSKSGDVLGEEDDVVSPVLEPVLVYEMKLQEGADPKMYLPQFQQLVEEEPTLRITWDEQLEVIKVHIMGEVQTEILQSIIKERFGIDVEFVSGSVVYKETIANTVEGVGHFEPLKHYAEVHLLMEPGERGSGLYFSSECSDDVLNKNWRNLVLTHLKEKKHKGVLTGSEITDMKITLVSGRAHVKHTEGGDFREATYRAVRQGLKEAESILLEPFYSFQLEVPEALVGRAMTDIDQMHGTCQVSRIEGGVAHITGNCPIVTMRNYQKDIMAYSKGEGNLYCSFSGYEPCHNADEVIGMMGYDSETDAENPTGSVFCTKGAGFFVPWDEVKEHMHVESYLKDKDDEIDETKIKKSTYKGEQWIEADEVDRIFKRTFFANKKDKSYSSRKIPRYEKYKPQTYANKVDEPKKERLREDTLKKECLREDTLKKECLLVDGYNVIFAWPELNELAQGNMDSARMKLVDDLIKYQSIKKLNIIVVFDAYRVEGRGENIKINDNMYVVYTKEAQTADNYIERFAHENNKKYNVTVATSDGLQQIIIRGEGCAIISSRELKIEIDVAIEGFIKAYQESKTKYHNYLENALSDESMKVIEQLINNREGKMS